MVWPAICNVLRVTALTPSTSRPAAFDVSTAATPAPVDAAVLQFKTLLQGLVEDTSASAAPESPQLPDSAGDPDAKGSRTGSAATDEKAHTDAKTKGPRALSVWCVAPPEPAQEPMVMCGTTVLPPLKEPVAPLGDPMPAPAVAAAEPGNAEPGSSES